MNVRCPSLKWVDHGEIVERLLRGEVGCTPTETVAGILGLPRQVSRINQIKKSPSSKPIAQLIGSTEQAQEVWGELDPSVESLAQLWPGALTLVVGEPTGIALRMPALEQLQDILKKTGPMACSSANFSGDDTPGGVGEVKGDFLDRVDFVINEQPEKVLGQSSTILKKEGTIWTILRQGSLERETIRERVVKSGCTLE